MRTLSLAWAGIISVSVLLAAAPAHQGNPVEAENPASPDSGSTDEKLVYTVKWDPPWYLFFLPAMEAGEVEVQSIRASEYKGKMVRKILFQAHSSGTLMKMTGMTIDDEFVFFAEPGTFCTLHVHKKIREGKRKRQIDIDYLPETHQLHFREMDESVDPPKLKKDEIKDEIPPCVLDPLSAVFIYRRSQLKVGNTQTLLIGHDDKVREVTARVEKEETLKTNAGNVPAWKISVISLMGGLFKEGGQFRLWLSADEKKTPLQFEFKVRLGRVLGKLKSRKP